MACNDVAPVACVMGAMSAARYAAMRDATGRLLDHLVGGGEQHRWHVKA